MTLSVRGPKELGNLILSILLNFSNFLLLFIWLQNRAKNDCNGVKIAILAEKSQKSPGGWGLCAPGPLCDTLQLHQFVQLRA